MGIVIINGKRYDSVTGLMLADQNSVMPETNNIQQSAQMPDWIGNFIDKRNQIKTSNQSAAETAVDEPTTLATHRTNAAFARRTAMQSRTLNRRFVSRPSTAQPIKVKHTATTNVINIPEETIAEAAKQTDQDFIPILTRRQAEGINKLANKAPLSERVAMAEQQSTAPATVGSFNYEDALDDRLAQLSEILQNAAELDQRDIYGNNMVETPLTRAVKGEQSAQTAKKTRKKFSPRAIFATAGAMATIAAIGVYMAMPSISVKIAANKAGVDAKNPYAPAGYSINGEIAYQEGKVTINYSSKSGSDGYSVTQESSDLNDYELRNEVSEQNSGYYQEMTAGSKNVYVYNDKITWINNGIRYTIDSNDYLDNDQITSIVESL